MARKQKSKNFSIVHISLNGNVRLENLAERLNRIRRATMPEPSLRAMGITALEQFAESRELELFGKDEAGKIHKKTKDLANG